MASIKSSVILIWAGNHADIPAGWTRETSLDSKFPKGTANATNPNTTGGASTHQHSATASHSHTQAVHTHTYTLEFPTVSAKQADAEVSTSMKLQHTHTGTSGNSSGGDLDNIASTYASFSNNPPYYEVIFIKPSADTSNVPANVIGFYDSSTIPTGFAFCNGTGTPDLRNKYLRGAGTGANAGGTGGSVTNVHDLTHTHTVSAHSHGNSTSTTATADKRTNPTTDVATTHSHTVTLANATATLTGTPQLTTTETVEPAYTKLIPAQNTSGGAVKIPLNTIALFLGNLSAIPAGWVLCDGNNGTKDMRSRHLKCANATSEAGNTGGSNTHSHGNQTHTHTGVAHNHTATHSAHTAGSAEHGTSGGYMATTSSTHPITVANSTATYSDGTTAGDSQNNEPEYRTVAFIKLLKYAGGAGFLLTQI